MPPLLSVMAARVPSKLFLATFSVADIGMGTFFFLLTGAVVGESISGASVTCYSSDPFGDSIELV